MNPSILEEPTTVRFSLGKNRFDAHPLQREVESFQEFQEAVLNTRAAIKGLFYIASAFTPDGSGKAHRSKDNVLPTSFLCFDFDSIPGPDEFAGLCMFMSQFEGFGYTTASHTAEKPRARAILALDREVSREERIRISHQVQAAIEKTVKGLKFDQSVYRPEQPCFTPVFESESFTWNGDVINADEWLEGAPEIKPEGPSQAANVTRIETTDPVLQMLKMNEMVKKDLGNGRYAVTCPCSDEHSGPSESETATVYTLPKFNGFDLGNFTCLHDHCANRPQKEFLEALGMDHGKTRAKQTEVQNVDHSELKKNQEIKKAPNPNRFTFLKAGDLRRQQRVGWRVLDVIPKKGLVVMWGQPGSGKSFAAFDIGAAIARGMKYQGKRVKQGLVLIIAAEGDLTARTMAYMKEHNLRDEDLENLMILQRSVNMLDQNQDMNDLMASIQAAKDEAQEDLALVIVDTLNRVMPGGNENASEHMGAVISSAKLIEDAHQCAVMFIHHSGKDEGKGTRGHSSLKGAMDAEISILRNEDIRTFKIEKQKEGKDYYELFNFKLKTVDLGPMSDFDPEAEYGERLTSCVLEVTDEMPQSKAPTKNQDIFEQAIEQAESGNREVVRLKYYELHRGTAEAKRRGFNRSWNAYSRSHLAEGYVPKYPKEGE